ncbi:glycosyltransferase [Winogradskyella litoriviva]|uniref:Glycosyltransferase n=1 Tax=Winogradskyella litoriviva TaxID=1220182 RepID=A0ABX2E3J4_9FLAO|nr:glycosyltransferase [Winogradskyella litoriviva]NRD22817.1 glycosyltransferase [Winogradskyella litoriviva]
MRKNNKTLAVFTLVVHKKKNGQLYGYSPYINEMNMWTSHFDKVIVVGNFSNSENIDKLESPYNHTNISLVKVPGFNVKSVFSIAKLFFYLPLIIFRMVRVMYQSDYFHFRCPSNVSAIAAIVQVFFPRIPKTTKYAGNWNPNSNQPLGYRFQKWLLSNTFLTKNMKVLVYGDWENQSKSVVPFMSATYTESEKIEFKKREYSKKLKFVFTGAMVVGKRPMLTIKIIEALIEKGILAELHMFGDGPLMNDIKLYLNEKKLNNNVFIYGNQPKEKVKTCLLDAHFSILPSKSEGWPKAIAEGMFFGTIPISTKISCLPWILDFGKRGILIEANLERAVETILESIHKGNEHLNGLSHNALRWSQQYTVDRLENEISKLTII